MERYNKNKARIKVLPLMLSLALSLSMVSPALAVEVTFEDGTSAIIEDASESTGGGTSGTNESDVDTKEPEEVSYYGKEYHCSVKSGSSSSSIKNTMYSTLTTTISQDTSHGVSDILMVSSVPQTLTSDGSISFKVTYDDKNYETVIVNYQVLEPEAYEFKSDIKDIYADSEYNTSFNNLVNYVNSDLILRTIGDDYNAALGDAVVTAPKFTSKNCTDTYNPYGDVTYTFIQEFNGSTLVREFTVNSVSKPTPNVSIDYNNNILKGTNTQMSYSLDGTKWSSCKNNMDIASNMMGSTVYFKYLATNYYPESSMTSIYIPEKAEKPSEKLELVSSSKAITIMNCDDFEDCEFSINGTSWVTTNNTTYTFKYLSPSTSYKVYVRVEADPGDNLASDAITSSIKTLSKEDAGVTVRTTTNRNISTVFGILAVESDLSNKKLTATVTSSDLEKLIDTVKDLVNSNKKTEAILAVQQFPMGSEDITATKVSIPLSTLKTAIKEAGLGINYTSDLFNVEISNGSISSNTSSTVYLEFSKVTSTPTGSKLDWVKEQYKDGRPVYKVSTEIGSKDLTVTYVIPYTLERNETISELNVYSVDTNGNKRNLNAVYNTVTGTFQFTTNDQGYIVIADDGVYNTMPFTDVPTNFWAYSYIKYCYNKGIFAGVSSTRFDTGSNVTRAQIFTLMARMSGFDTTSSITESKFNDVPINAWYAPSANWAVENKLVSGKTFDGNGEMTRSDIAVVLYNFMTLMDYESDANYKDLNFTDIDKCSSSAKKAIAVVNDLGIMVGTSGTTFNPNDNVTRAQMATILYRLDNILN